MYYSFTANGIERNIMKFSELVHAVPRDRILLETDSPDQLPRDLITPTRTHSEPSLVRLVCERISHVLGMDVRELARITSENAYRVYRTNTR